MAIYLIDDDVVSLFVAEQTLRAEGLTAPIVPFTGADDALAYLLPRLATDPPEFIFLDLNMPLMDGWQFLDGLVCHAAALKDRCRIYLLTSSLALADTEKARGHALVQGIIHKPLDEVSIRAAVRERTQTVPVAAPGAAAAGSR